MEKNYAFKNRIEEVTKLVSFVREKKNIELEARLGFLKGRKFDANVKKNFFKSCLKMCESFEGWECVKNWHSRRDYFLKNNVRVSVFSEPVHHKVSLRKKKLKTLTFPIVSKDNKNRPNLPTTISGSRGDEEESPTALRVDASVEDVVTGDIKDQVPHFVRYKVIKQFKTKSGWSFDFSKTFTDVDPQIVIDKSSMFTEDDSEDTASYELEIELENFTYIAKKSDLDVATSLLLKVFDFLPYDVFI